jgi:HEAT repeat protein/predicted Ser/Thr protein kinase
MSAKDRSDGFARWPRAWFDLADRFQEAWRTGQRPDLEAYASQVSGDGPDVVCLREELLRIELEERRKLGERPVPEDYRRQFPGHAAVAAAFRADLLDRFALAWGNGGRPRLEDYVAEARELQDRSAVLAILRCEFDQRITRRERPVLAEYHEKLTGCLEEVDAAFPARMGRFRVERVLGQGAFGLVYLGWDDQLGRPVALKVSRRRSEDLPQGFLSEARTMAGFDAPDIVAVYEIGELGGGAHFLAMRYLEGGSLADLLDRDRPPLDQAAGLMISIATAVEKIHRKGIVHRDLKPANILFDDEGEPHVGDFGLAFHAVDQRSQTGVAAGTWAYMAPEMVRGAADQADARADVWSLGVILYELLTGARPFTGATRDLKDAVLRLAPKPPSRMDDSVPPELEAICLQCLQKDPGNRYASAGAVAAAVETWQTADVEATTDVQAAIEAVLRAQLTYIDGVSQAAGDGRPLVEQFIDVPLVRGEEAWASDQKQSRDSRSSRVREVIRGVQDLMAVPLGVILGDPAAGKTTLLQYMVAAQCRHQLERLAAREISHWAVEPACFFRGIDLAGAVSAEPRPVLADAIIRLLLPEDTAARARRWLLNAIEEGRFLLAVDGLDEVPHAGDLRRRLLDRLQEFHGRHPKARLWLSSRRSGYPGPSLAVPRRNHFALEPLDDGRMERFARRWLRAGAGAFLEGVQARPALWELLRTPLLLRLACQLAERAQPRGERLPRWTRRMELLRDFIHHLIDREVEKRGQEPRNGWRSSFSPFASEVALRLQERYPGENQFSEAVVVEAVAASNEALPEEARGYTREDLSAVGLLNFIGVEGAGVPLAWFHRTVQEYLAGVALARQGIEACCKAVAEHCYEPEWQEVLTLAGAALSDRDLPEFLGECVRLEEQDALDRPMEIAVRAVAASADSLALRSLRTNLRDTAVIKYILRDPWDVEEDVTHWIRSWGHEAWEPLRDWVVETRPFRHSRKVNLLRLTAARAISGLGIRDAEEFFLRIVGDDDEDILVRAEAIEALARRQVPCMLPHLVGFVRHPDLAPYAIPAIRHFEPPDGTLRRRLRKELRSLATNYWEIDEVRADAVRSLGWLEEPADRRLIRRLLAEQCFNDKLIPLDLHVACIEAIVRREDPNGLSTFLNSKRPDVRAAAARTAAFLHVHDLGDRLCTLLGDREAAVRRAAADAVATLEIAEAVTPLRRLFQEDDACRWEAASALARLTIAGLADARQEVKPHLLRQLTEPRPLNALLLLCQLEADEVIPQVEDIIRSRGESAANAALVELYVVADALTKAPIRFLLRHETRLRGILESRIRREELYIEARERMGLVLRRYLVYHREPWAGPPRRSYIQRELRRTTLADLLWPERVSFRGVLEWHLRFLSGDDV